MDPLADFTGCCPGCDLPGLVAEPCDQPTCRRRGLHAIPAAWVSDLDPSRDPGIGLRIDDHLVVAVLGTGGFGRVYLALQLPLGMRVALKLADPAALTAAPGRSAPPMEREAQALARLSHPNVVRLLRHGVWCVADDRGAPARRPYLVTEYIPGGRSLEDALAEWAQRREPVGREWAATILRQLLDGLGAAHAAGVVHRDVKPANIMLQSVATDGVEAEGAPLVRLLDFGLARVGEARSAAPTDPDDFEAEDPDEVGMGTPTHMAPEQIHGGPIGPWTDLYAAGVLAFELLVGRAPFDGDNVDAVMRQRVDLSFDPLAAAGPLPERCERFLRQALAFEPEDRYQSAAAMRKALDAALSVWPAARAAAPTGSTRRTVTRPTIVRPPATGADPLAAPALAPSTGVSALRARAEITASSDRRIRPTGRPDESLKDARSDCAFVEPPSGPPPRSSDSLIPARALIAGVDEAAWFGEPAAGAVAASESVEDAWFGVDPAPVAASASSGAVATPRRGARRRRLAVAAALGLVALLVAVAFAGPGAEPPRPRADVVPADAPWSGEPEELVMASPAPNPEPIAVEPPVAVVPPPLIDRARRCELTRDDLAALATACAVEHGCVTLEIGRGLERWVELEAPPAVESASIASLVFAFAPQSFDDARRCGARWRRGGAIVEGAWDAIAAGHGGYLRPQVSVEVRRVSPARQQARRHQLTARAAHPEALDALQGELAGGALSCFEASELGGPRPFPLSVRAVEELSFHGVGLGYTGEAGLNPCPLDLERVYVLTAPLGAAPSSSAAPVATR